MKFDTSTIEGRHELYKAMLEEVDRPVPNETEGTPVTHSGLCFLAYYFDVDIYWLHSALVNAPELIAKKPETTFDSRHWFEPGKWKERREILVQCIEETKPKSDGTTHIQIHSSGEDN